MLQYINNLPDDVLGIHAIGEITKQDMETVLLPRLDELAKRQGEIKYLLVLETDVSNFTLAAWWKDLVAGIKHFTEWKRIAVVSDQKGVEWFTDAFTHFIPGTAKGFSLSELDEATKWISANN
ncbi:SpoIIAA family protein [Mucilaginibacter antarcticus]|uniref:STAS/SEC14 domain-containing protein n=1 Tax=Mucilaginibacter antarcticus TaxID=1855725 RepID=A0ABW5XJH3_9SPHI